MADIKPDEFVKEVRDYIADFIYAEEHNVPMQHEPRCLEADLAQSLSIITAQQARIEKLESNQCQNCIGIEALEEK